MSLVRQHRSLRVLSQATDDMSQLVPKHMSLLVPLLPDDMSQLVPQHMS